MGYSPKALLESPISTLVLRGKRKIAQGNPPLIDCDSADLVSGGAIHEIQHPADVIEAQHAVQLSQNILRFDFRKGDMAVGHLGHQPDIGALIDGLHETCHIDRECNRTVFSLNAGQVNCSGKRADEPLLELPERP